VGVRRIGVIRSILLLVAIVLALPRLSSVSLVLYDSSSGTSRSNGSETRDRVDLWSAPAGLSTDEGGLVGPGSPQDEGKESERVDENDEDEELL